MGIIVLVMYLFAIVGFDIHNDFEHGEVYVISALQDSSCEKVHPEHQCHDHSHCSCHGHCAGSDRCISGEECCSDSIVMLLADAGVEDGCQIPSSGPEGTGIPVHCTAVACSLMPQVCIPCPFHSPPGNFSIRKNCIMRV